MLKPILTLTAAALCLSACAQPKTWNQPGMTPQDYAVDVARCHEYVRETTPPSFAIGGVLFLAAVAVSQHNVAQHAFDDCMVEHGWSEAQ